MPALATLLEHEHHEIDAGIAAILEGLAQDEIRDQELTRAVDALRRQSISRTVGATRSSPTK